MIDVEAQRTLVKSPPELWGLLSDPESLARELAEFGEVRIVSTEPESTVSWEGQAVTGTVRLKASGWGTKVTLTATRQPPAPPEPAPVVVAPPPVIAPIVAPQPAVEPEPAPEAELEPVPDPAELAPAPARRQGFFARLFRRRPAPASASSAPAPAPAPAPEAMQPEPTPAAMQPTPEPEPEPQAAVEAEQPDLAAELLALEESLVAETTAVLTAVLDKLGAAHHRPFSRA